ncbi:hypothetical protein Tco_1571648, partial [Tanacetum coccineum]
SRVITKYVAEAYADEGESLILKDRKKSAIQSVWMEVENHKYFPTTSKLGYELIYKPKLGQTIDETIVGSWKRS